MFRQMAAMHTFRQFTHQLRVVIIPTHERDILLEELYNRACFDFNSAVNGAV